MRTYDELKKVCMFVQDGYTPTQQELDTKCIVKPIGVGYGTSDYRILNNPPHLHLTKEEIALFCDGGNLPFGYGAAGNYISVYTD